MHEAVKRWAAKGEFPVTLPSGMRVKVRPRSAVEMVRDRSMPTELRKRALEYETGTFDPKALTEEEQLKAYDFMRSFVARSVVAIESEDGSGWAEVALEAEDLATIPEDDVSALQAIVTLRKSANQVTAESEVKLGTRSAEDAARIAREEAGTTVDGWTEFPDGRRGDPAGTNGATLREIPRDRLPARRGPRARARAG